MNKIKDLIEVPEVRTVIQLSDSQDPKLRKFLTHSFLLTGEAKKVLTSLFHNISKKAGKGFFLEGNFGSGKSHLLTIINLLLNYEDSWEPLLEQDDTGKLKKYKNEIKIKDFTTVNISLVEHSSSENLEDIIGRKLIDNFSSLSMYKDENTYLRKEFYQTLAQEFDNHNSEGLIILIDELSEFLRSKPDGRSFNEDIRYLQFMGEFVTGRSCWLMATLQEAIEKTGEITQEIFGKIKDRYPVHFHLSGTHIKQIVSKRLIKKKPGSEEIIENIYKKYSSSFKNWQVNKKQFIDLYPVNPLTISLLDNLKPLFSQHRGIIDFIHYRLRGDESRGIPAMLAEPASVLLNPDLIFDHFLDRLRERMETREYYEKVFRYYEQEISSILDEEDIDTGLRLIKLLIMFAVSPVEKEYTVSDMVHMVMEPITDLEAEVNYEYISDLLEKMYRHGAYLVRNNNHEADQVSYKLDLEADINRIIKEKTRFIRSNFFAEEERIFTRVGQIVDESYLPLSRLLEKSRSARSLTWQNTRRKGFFVLSAFTDITLKNISQVQKRLQEAVLNSEDIPEDFIIFAGYPLKVEEQKEYLKEVILPELDAEIRSAFCFWLPREAEKKEFLREVLARQLLYEQYENKDGETSNKVQTRLSSLLQKDAQQAAAVFRDSFFEGVIIDGNGENILSDQDRGPVSFNKFFNKIAQQILNKRYSSHVEIAPYRSVLNKSQLNRLAGHFLEQGVITEQEAQDRGVLNIIEDFLQPMGLIKKRSSKIRLDLNPGENPLIREFFALLEREKTDINDIFCTLRRSSWGLCNQQFILLNLVLLFGGYITAYSEHQKIALNQLNVYNFDRIKYIGPGEIVNEEFQEILQKCDLLPPRFKKQPFSLPVQKQMWDYITEWKRDYDQKVDDLNTKISTLQPENGFSFLDDNEINKIFNKLNDLLSEIKVSYSAEEGLERFAAFYRSSPNIDRYRERFEKLSQFFTEYIERYRDMENYLSEMPALTEDNYRKLKNKKEELQSELQDREIVFSDDFRKNVEDKFKEFRGEYTEKYYQEHNKFFAGENFQKYKKIKEKKNYLVLSYLSDIEMISVKNDFIKVKRLLARILRQQCGNLKQHYLMQNPVCRCGFKPGDRPEMVSLEEIYALISRGINEYMQKLISDEFRPLIEEYLSGMEEVGKKRFARPIRDLLSAADEIQAGQLSGEMIEQLESILNRNIINRINQALKGNISLEERDLEELYENLVGRSFAPDQIRKIFNEWLEGDQKLDRHSYIRIITKKDRKQPKKEQPVGDYLMEYYPELLNLFDEMGSEHFVFYTALWVWKDNHNISTASIKEKFSFPEKIKAADTKLYHEIWQQVLNQEQNDKFENHIKVGQKMRKILDSFLLEDNRLERLLDLLSLEEIEDITTVLKNEFISEELQKKLILLLFKTGEQISRPRFREDLVPELRSEAEKTSEPVHSSALQTTALYLDICSVLSFVEDTFLADESNDEVKTEEFYKKYISNLEFDFSHLIYLTRELNIKSKLPLNRLKRKIDRVLNNFSKRFSTSKEKMDISELILDHFPDLLDKISFQHNCVLLMDGMRWDTWEIIRAEIRKDIPLRIINEGSIYAQQPTNTETQIKKLEDKGYPGQIIKPRDFKIENLQSQDDYGKNNITRFSYIDDRIHTSKDNYYNFMQEIIFHTQNRLLPFIKELPSRTAVLIFSDHGYRINHKFSERNKFEEPRYLHGGDSAFEIIVPWALLYLV